MVSPAVGKVDRRGIHHSVYLFLDKKTCYFETNSILLHEKLFLVRGVDQEDYDSDSLWLQELISIIENMQNQDAKLYNIIEINTLKVKSLPL